MNPCVLFVDDEVGILNALKRQFRGGDYNVLTASSGAAALKILENESVDLIVSDMRMPHMDGAEFLAKAKKLDPEVVRILLTGFSDLEATTRAINDGGIFGYLTKPWDNKQLVALINSGIAHRTSLQQKNMAVTSVIKEREALKDKIKHQQREMAMADQYVRDAYNSLQDGYKRIEEVLVNLLNLKHPKQREISEQVATVVQQIATQLCLNDREKQLLNSAAKLHSVGKISLADSLLNKPIVSYSKSEHDAYLAYPSLGACTLLSFPPYQEVSKIITLQKAYLDGSGTAIDKDLSDLTIYSRILMVAIDYVDLRIGVFDSLRKEHEEAIYTLESYAPRYDERLIALLSTVTMGVNEIEQEVDIQIPVQSLRRGMILNKNIYTPSGTLLLKKDTRLSVSVIDQLQRIQKNINETLIASVRFDVSQGSVNNNKVVSLDNSMRR
ncbi:MAG: response regulator [Pseudomonadales bacterium]|nr:response regulator [Pseudomonadales bacterium]